MKMVLVKSQNGYLCGGDEATQDRLNRMKTGQYVLGEFKRVRNIGHHRKFFALLNFAFDLWSERRPPQTYRGMEVLPNFDSFRRDVTILAGFGRPIVNIRNEVRFEADSIAFESMDQDTFEDLYSRVVDVIIQKVLPTLNFTPESLNEAIDRTLEFA